jgi:hypothetical protein
VGLLQLAWHVDIGAAAAVLWRWVWLACCCSYSWCHGLLFQVVSCRQAFSKANSKLRQVVGCTVVNRRRQSAPLLVVESLSTAAVEPYQIIVRSTVAVASYTHTCAAATALRGLRHSDALFASALFVPSACIHFGCDWFRLLHCVL